MINDYDWSVERAFWVITVGIKKMIQEAAASLSAEEIRELNNNIEVFYNFLKEYYST